VIGNLETTKTVDDIDDQQLRPMSTDFACCVLLNSPAVYRLLTTRISVLLVDMSPCSQ